MDADHHPRMAIGDGSGSESSDRQRRGQREGRQDVQGGPHEHRKVRYCLLFGVCGCGCILVAVIGLL